MTVTPLVKFAITRQLTRGRRRRASPSWMRSTKSSVRFADGERRDRLVEVQPALDAGVARAARLRSGCSPCARARRHSRATSSTSATSDRPTTASAGTGIACSRRACSAASRARRRCSSGSRSAIRGRSAAGTSTTSRRPAAIACSTRRWSTATACSRCSSIPGRCGTPARTRKVRFSTGFGFTPGPVFMTVGFPLNTDEFRAVFTMGFRFAIGLRRHQKN